MTETLRLFARFNAHSNQAMNAVLAQLPPTDWTRDLGGFYSSFQALVGHMYTTDIAWLVRFTALRPFAALQGEPFDFPPPPGQNPFESFADYQSKRRALDSAIVAFTEELVEGDVRSDLSYRNFRGEEINKNLGGLVLHFFNHQTHHRGMVALYLDQLDVPNDFNGLSSIL